MPLKVVRLCLVYLAPLAIGLSLFAQSRNFALRDGDRVTFYGDSITEQREYTEDVENFVLTRYPSWKVSFHNAGVGGDKVSGGWAGPIDLRLDRDVFAWRPDVITIMLGMNDFFYRPDQPGIYSSYTDGYRHIVESLQKTLPNARITLIQPAPYDDVTREPAFPGGGNAVLLLIRPRWYATFSSLSPSKSVWRGLIRGSCRNRH